MTIIRFPRNPDNPPPPSPAYALQDPTQAQEDDIVVYATASTPPNVIAGTVVSVGDGYVNVSCNAKVYGNGTGFGVRTRPGIAPTWTVWFSHQRGRVWAFRLQRAIVPVPVDVLPIGDVDEVAA